MLYQEEFRVFDLCIFILGIFHDITYQCIIYKNSNIILTLKDEQVVMTYFKEISEEPGKSKKRLDRVTGLKTKTRNRDVPRKAMCLH